jgi:predicted DNA-binding transcriptional regulator YafY
MLRARRRVTAGQLAQMFSVTERTIYRDMQVLSESNVPIAASPGIEGGYELQSGYYVPPVMFTKEEATAIFLGGSFIERRHGSPFCEAIVSGLAKLETLLPETARQPALVTKDNVRWDVTDHTPSPNQSGSLLLITEAIQAQQCVYLRYENEGIVSHRVVAPYGVVYSDGKWYLIGYCHLRAALRMFRVDRIAEASLDPQTFERPEGFDLDAYTNMQWAESLEAQLRTVAPSVTLRVRPRILQELDQHWLYRYSRREPSGEHTLVTIHDDDPAAILRMVRQWGSDVELVAPQALRDQLKDEGEALVRRYGQLGSEAK